MEEITTPSEMRSHVQRLRQQGLSVGFVPTMGFLHAGHMALVERAARECNRVVVSIFVNPTQFGDMADLEKYPRNLERDTKMLRDAGVDALFLPENKTMYPMGAETFVETMRLSSILHGAVRADHFRGVSTVVTKLFNIVQPDIACFGEKDYQQLQVIRTMVRDLHFPVRIVGCPTVRDPDGLAMSSRNVRLSKEDRQAALVLSRSLDMAETIVAEGTSVAALETAVADAILAEPRATLKAVDIAEAETLHPIEGPITGPIALMISAEFGGTLLIDQREVHP